MKPALLLSVTLLVPLLRPPLAAGDEVQELQARVQAIQRENERLRALLDEQARFIQELSTRVEHLAAGQAAAGAQPVPEVSPAPPREDTSSTPQLFIRGFADTTAYAESRKSNISDVQNAFALNELDLLLTSQIASELSVLSEVVFHFEEIEEDAFFEVERIYLKYSPSSLFNLKLGRLHTAIGYWNQTFHHGSWFQTTVDRPELFVFEDDGGILPVHSVGLEAYGNKSWSALDLGYSAGVFNGRGEFLSSVQNVSDANRSKGINLRLTASPSAVPGLEMGFTTYFDRFPASDAALRPPVDERIFGAHVVYSDARTELLAELARISHREASSARNHHSAGLYFQVAHEFGRWKPYYRFDFFDIDEADPVFTPLQQDLQRHTAGVRWDLSTWAALKFEYAHERRPLFRFDRGAVQAAFTF